MIGLVPVKGPHPTPCPTHKKEEIKDTKEKNNDGEKIEPQSSLNEPLFSILEMENAIIEHEERHLELEELNKKLNEELSKFVFAYRSLRPEYINLLKSMDSLKTKYKELNRIKSK